MKIADLYEYRKLSEEYDCASEQLEYKHSKDSVYGDSGEPAHEKITRSVEGYIHGVGTISLLRKKSECKRKMQEIEEYIYAIPVKIYREALKKYCLDMKRKYKWEELAEQLDYDGDLRRNIANYLAKISDCEK